MAENLIHPVTYQNIFSRMGIKKTLFVLLVPIFLISSSIVLDNTQAAFALTPVADLTGEWSGFAQVSFTGTPCETAGKVNGFFKQHENNLQGRFSFVPTSTGTDSGVCSYEPWDLDVNGIIDGSRITLNSEGITFTGWYASAGIKLDFAAEWLVGTTQLSPTNFIPPPFKAADVGNEEVKKKNAEAKKLAENDDKTPSASTEVKKPAEDEAKKKKAEAKKLAEEEAKKKKAAQAKKAEEAKKKAAEAKKVATEEAKKKKTAEDTRWDAALSTLHEQKIEPKAKAAGKLLKSSTIQKILLPLVSKEEGSMPVTLFKYYTNGPDKSDLAKEDYKLENIPPKWKDWIIKEMKGLKDGRHNLSPYYDKIRKTGGPDDLVHALGHFDVTVRTNPDGSRTYLVEDLYQFGFDLNKKLEEQRHGFTFNTQDKIKLNALKLFCYGVPQVEHPVGEMEECEIRERGNGYEILLPQQILSSSGKPFLVKGEFTK